MDQKEFNDKEFLENNASPAISSKKQSALRAICPTGQRGRRFNQRGF